METHTNDRRSFLGTAAIAAAGTAIVGTQESHAAEQGDSRGPLRIGCLNVDSYSHLMGLWGPLINRRKGESDMSFTDMRITHCWEIEYDRAKAFADLYGCEAVRDFDGMLGKVDCIINGGYYNHPWNHIIHEPYLEAGLPNLINRPFSNSLAKAKRIIDLARKHNAPILVPSSHELTEAISRAKQWATGKKIICYSATNSFDDYPTHGVHGVYMSMKAIAESGHPPVSVSYRAKSWYSPPGVLTYEHLNEDGSTFFGTLHQVSGSWGTVQIHTSDAYGGESFPIRTGVGFPANKSQVWAPVIWVFQRMAMYGEMPQTHEQILEKTRVFLAGWKSVLERNGAPVRLDEIPDDWESPVELPNHPDQNTASLFRKRFG